MQSSMVKAGEVNDKKDAPVEEEKKLIADDFFYPENHVETVLDDSSITRNSLFFQ
jgi:hypothetical protein